MSSDQILRPKQCHTLRLVTRVLGLPRVYVILLDPSVLRHPSILRLNPGVGEQRSIYGTRSITAPLLPNTQPESRADKALRLRRHDRTTGRAALRESQERTEIGLGRQKVRPPIDA